MVGTMVYALVGYDPTSYSDTYGFTKRWLWTQSMNFVGNNRCVQAARQEACRCDLVLSGLLGSGLPNHTDRWVADRLTGGCS